ncbi:MAG: DUF2326 domain-containing protein [Bacteroidales bacterium]|nr:DUF2326 domain-containing protein [Bacteroidales bacterium]
MLVKLYSETDLLVKPFSFEPGLNIILGKYSGDKDQRGINGIGKSSLIRLINYALLSDSSERRFSKEKYDFLRKENHNLILELKIKDEIHYIKRFFAKKEKVYFGTKYNSLEEYSKTDLRKILINKLFPIEKEDVYIEGNKFGSLLDFFLKDDLATISRIEPLKFSDAIRNTKDVAIYNFFLLNLSNRYILRYDELTKEYDSYSNTIKGLQDKIKVDSGKTIEEFKTERIKIEQNISLLEKSLQDYKFLENYKNIEGQLIEITTSINEKLKTYYSLSNKHKKIRDSFHLSQDFDTKQIQKLYNEVIQTFGDIVTKTLGEIANFKKEIIENRNKFLIAKEKQIESSIKDTLEEISKLEKTRSQLYKKLDERGALESIRNTFEQLTIEKSQLAGNLAILTQVDEIQEMLSNLDITISEIKRDMLIEIKTYEEQINNLRSLFQDILENAIFLEDDNPNGYFDISPKINSQKRNELPFKIDIEIPKADALGQSRLKIVAYDLMVFFNNIYNKRKFPDFLIHDGVYHGISINTKVKALNYIYHQHLANPNFQYIATFNEDEIYIPKEKQSLIGQFDFDIEKMVRAEFTDSPERMIFKRSFK